MLQNLSEVSEDAPLFRILCVEDNVPHQQILKAALAAYGFDVVTASDGIEGLVKYKAHEGQFGAIVSDHDMPQMNGLAFVRSVWEMGYKGRIVLMSGRLTVEELREYAPHLISGFFHKPFQVSLLAAILLQAD
jgi:CheY-like chemotaxis protein